MHLNFNLPKKILAWYDNNKRSLPWRVGKNSHNKLYYRLTSEFMLQQTQVKTVIPYFEKFTKKFKSLKSLSRAREHKVLKLWEGLGYYRRAKNLLSTSKILVNCYNSKLPKTFKEIKSLPGIGDYTANVLIALIHNRPAIALDGNVKRVFSRLLNRNEEKINFSKFIDDNSKVIFSKKRSSDLAEALMEFGALVCRPINPNCMKCCFKKSCKYFNSSKKIKKNNNKVIKTKNLNVFCYLRKDGRMALTKNNNFGFLSELNLPKIQKKRAQFKYNKWKFLKKYENSISNKKLSINLYYRFSEKIPQNFNWYSLKNNEDFIPSFTKKVFKQVSVLFS